MVTIPGLSGVKFNPETGLYEVKEKPEGESNLYGGANITLQNTGANITRRAGAETGGIDYSKIGSDAAAASIAAQVGEDGTTPAEYFAGIQEQIDSYVPGTFGSEYLAQVQEERKAATPVEDKEEEEPYKSEIKSLKLPKNVLEEISTGYKGLKESDYKGKEISFDGKGFNEYMSTDGDRKEIQPMLDAGMDKIDIKRWGKALGYKNVDETREAKDIVKAYQQGYLPGKKPGTSYQLSNTVQDRFGNVFTVSEYDKLKDSGTKDKEIEKFLEDFIKGGGRVGSNFSVKVPEITIPGFR
jgi:hypothetical protein